MTIFIEMNTEINYLMSFIGDLRAESRTKSKVSMIKKICALKQGQSLIDESELSISEYMLKSSMRHC